MKYILANYTFAILFTIATPSFAQVVITDDGSPETVDNSAVFELQSNSKGMIAPKMTTAQRNAIANPATGLIVFDTSYNRIFVYNGSEWETSRSNWVGSNNRIKLLPKDFIGTVKDDKKAKTIGLTGFSGGKLGFLAKVSLIAQVNDMQKIEDMHMIAVHIIMQIICGKLHGKYITWYKNEKKKKEEIYKDGKRHGKWIKWYENEKKQSETNYKNGKRHGRYITWNKDGKKKNESNYKDGKRHGKRIQRDKDGKIISERNFKDGKEIK